MITVKLMGGMGNQMFQYAFGLAQAVRLDTDLQLDTTFLGGKRKYVLNQWDGVFEPTVTGTVTGIAATVYEPGNMAYSQDLIDQIKDGDCLQGYWQSEKYFKEIKDDILGAFIPKHVYNRDNLAGEISCPNSVAVHVRRDDYLLPPHKEFHGLLGMEYYNLAMNYVREKVENPKFFVFSEDFDWISAYFQGPDITVVKPRQEAQDIFLMSLCSHAIIANSSFSWWAAYLGDQDGHENRIVVAPEKWFLDPQASYQDLVPERWTRL